MTPHTLSTAILVTHWLLVIGLSLRVIMRRSPVGVAVAWVAVVASVPFVGAIAYLLFGERRIGRQRARRSAVSLGELRRWQARFRIRDTSAVRSVKPEREPIRAQAARVLGFPATTGNSVELLEDADTVFDALVADIDAARSRCHACFYIWHSSGRVVDVVDALVRAAGRGVQCRMLADAIGSKVFFGGTLAHRLRAGGVELRAALPTGPVRAFFVRRDLRNHRKIVVIDGDVAYAGSQNLVDPQFFKQGAGVGEWVDAMARVTGPAAAALDAVFALDWAVETGGRCDFPAPDGQPPRADGAIVQVVPSGPALQADAIHQLLLTAIYSARRALVMTTPYFVPDDAMLTALLSAALRGVEVTLVVPARNDSVFVRHASVAHFDELASAGVTIALYEGGLLHTKSLTVDDDLSIFGSVNLDMRSMWLNEEISLFVYDAEFTRRLRALQTRYGESSRTLDLEEWRRRSTFRRFTEGVFRLVAPLL